MFKKGFPFFHQLDSVDCGPACLKMVAQYYGKHYTLENLRSKSHIEKKGVSVEGICRAAESIGLHSIAVNIPFDSQMGDEIDEAVFMNIPLPSIVYWEKRHFVVVHRIGKNKVWLADPADGKRTISFRAFKESWMSNEKTGVAILLEPTPEFQGREEDKINKTSFSYLFQFLMLYKKLILQLFIGLLVGSMLQLMVPFLTQALIDVGIKNQDVNFIYLVLFAQLGITISQLFIGFLQSWILLHIGTRINILMTSDFLKKLLRLPMPFFNTRSLGDLLQRIEDHNRIEYFLTNSIINFLLNVVTLVVFSVVLLMYSVQIFSIYLVFSLFFVFWVYVFLKKRRAVDLDLFKHNAANQSKLIEIIRGAREIKLQGSENKRRSHWLNIQSKLFGSKLDYLKVNQLQEGGAAIINQSQDIFIILLSALAVVNGEMTIGMMFSVQYIVGQLSNSIQQLVGFIGNVQDTKISMERLAEVHEAENEDDEVLGLVPRTEKGDIKLKNLSFKYNLSPNFALEDINLTIPFGKVVALVGQSGSGKTTLLKLLLGLYKPTDGNIYVNNVPFHNLNKRKWREMCGVVMQDSYIFSDTVANNITESDKAIDVDLLMNAVELSNIKGFIEGLDSGYNTWLGEKGIDVSEGQKQRILMSRAIYKDPKYLFLDEATNSLDATNEKIITDNLRTFFAGRTVLVIAHRLSTIKNADVIVVLDQGKIVEVGEHTSLMEEKGHYFELIENQLNNK